MPLLRRARRGAARRCGRRGGDRRRHSPSAAPAILLAGYDPLRGTRVGHGENGGCTLREGNVVRGIERLAVLMQASNGRFLAAAAEAAPR